MVAPGDAANPADVEEGFTWITIAVVLLSLGTVMNALANRRD